MAEQLEHSAWDGAGNEIKVVTTENEDGYMTQGTGPDTESAAANALKSADKLGGGADPAPESRYDKQSHHADENPTR